MINSKPVPSLDMVKYIDVRTQNEYEKLKMLYADIENFQTEIEVNAIVEVVDKQKIISNEFKEFKILVENCIRSHFKNLYKVNRFDVNEREKSYNNELSDYLKENDTPSESHFLNSKIKEVKIALNTIENKTQEDFELENKLTRVILFPDEWKVVQDKYYGKPNYEFYVEKYKTLCLKGRYHNKAELLKLHLKELSIKLARLSNKSEQTKEVKTTSKIKWKGKQTELIELIKALIENGSIEGLQKDTITVFSEMLDIKINNPDKLIQDIKKRNNKSETIFLDKLKTSLINFIAG